MDMKPTYEELEQKVKELERETVKREQAEEALEKNERKQLLSIFDSIDEPVYVSDPRTYELLYVNGALKKIFGDVLGHKCHHALQDRDSPCPFCTNDHIFGENVGRRYVWEFKNKRTGRWFHCIDKAIRWPDGRMVRYEMAIDITDRKQVEETLQERENDLEIKTQHLQEVNSALKVLLKQREEDKKELQENVIANVAELVVPYLENLSKSKLDHRQKGYIDIALSNLNDIVSPFIGSLSLNYLKLTPSEVQIASLIKHGKTTKDIADILNLSIETIKFHRKNIRDKIGIKDKKANLRTYLLSIQ